MMDVIGYLNLRSSANRRIIRGLTDLLLFIVTLSSVAANAQPWRKFDIPLIGSETVINSFLYKSLDTAYFAGSNNVLIASYGKGAKWEWIDPGLKCDICVANYYGLDSNAGALYVSVYYGSPFNANFRIKTTNGGASWDSVVAEVKTGPKAEHAITAQVEQRLHDSLRFVVVSESSDTLRYHLSLHVSTDRGLSWTKRSTIGSHTSGYSGQPPLDALGQFVIITDSIFLVQAHDVVAGGVFYRSKDQGRTWQSWRDSLYTWTLYKIEPDLLLGFDGTYDRSSDYGGTWDLPVSSPFPGWTGYAGLSINSNANGQVYALVDRSDLAKLLYHSSDFGDHWEAIDVAKGRWLAPPIFIDSIYAMGFTSDGIYTNLPLTASVRDPVLNEVVMVVDGDLVLPDKAKLANKIEVYDCIGRSYELRASVLDQRRYRLDIPHGVYLIPSFGKFVW